MSAWWTATLNILKSITTRHCPMAMLLLRIRPAISRNPMGTRMRLTNSFVRSRSCQSRLFLGSNFCPWLEPRLTTIFLGLALFAFSFSGCKEKEVETLLGPSQALVSVLTDEAAKLAGPKKQIALI